MSIGNRLKLLELIARRPVRTVDPSARAALAGFTDVELIRFDHAFTGGADLTEAETAKFESAFSGVAE